MPEPQTGQSFHRPNDAVLVRGRGRFLDDVALPSELHGHVLRSPYAHARIDAIDLTAALSAPGVRLILTAADYKEANLGALPNAAPLAPGWDLEGIHDPGRLPLASNTVRFVGDGIAFVVAETLAQAKDAAELIVIDFAPQAAVTSTAEAMDPAAPRVWNDCPNNIVFDHEKGDREVTDDAFERAYHVARSRFTISRVAANPIENRGIIADYDPNSGVHTVHVTAQSAFKIRRILARDIFDEPEERFHVTVNDVGGSFGMKGAFYPEYPLAVLAARKLEAPVRWVCERGEGLLSDFHGRDNISDTELALDENGKFIGLRVTIIANLGAYPSNFPAGPATSHVGGMAGVYTLPTAHIRIFGVYTHTNTISSYRGAGRPEASYVIERIIDVAAREMDIDPADLRRRNMIPATDIPYKTPFYFKYEGEDFGFFEYDSGDFIAVLEDALKTGDYEGFGARREEARGRGRLRGLGLAYIIEMAASPGFEYTEIHVIGDGLLTIYAGTSDCGQGHRTMYTQIACETLGVDPADVIFVQGDTARVRDGSGTSSSRTTSMGGSALLKAAEGVIQQGRKWAATLLQCNADEVHFDNGRFRHSSSKRSVGLNEVARIAMSDGVPGLRASATHRSLAPNWPNGCHICEVEVDPETGVIDAVDYAVVEDVGKVINPLLLAGQVHGGVAQGLGQALMERVVYDSPTGQMVTGSFLDYAMPRASDVIDVRVAHHPVPTNTNPLGVKGGGESGTIGSLPCVMNAVIDALAPLGIHDLDMPATPERVWSAIQSAPNPLS